ncbi:response regulator [Sphingosinithalassobacter portus]|uniref:response regulator n=1 Tax=Stakelama portus TaxID=2676234 RepID=UPI00195FD67F|nr:response regulator transcription factor [Sphingosinithalassobacter portus]
MIENLPLRILVADDHAILREGIVAVVERQQDMCVVAEASDGAAAVRMFAEQRPDIVLMDLQMPQLDGITAIEHIRAEASNATVLVLTTYADKVQAARALRAGAAGYVLKSCIRKDLVGAIRSVRAGRPVISPEIRVPDVDAGRGRLTAREIDILELVAAGQQNKCIAWQLSLSPETVKGHLKQIFAKLGVEDRTQAAIVATRKGFIGLRRQL